MKSDSNRLRQVHTDLKQKVSLSRFAQSLEAKKAPPSHNKDDFVCGVMIVSCGSQVSVFTVREETLYWNWSSASISQHSL